jgi:pimeloyl-ACP methyl ester carboxylesterase
VCLHRALRQEGKLIALFVDALRNPGAAVFEFPPGGNLPVLEEVVRLAAQADTPAGLLQHLAGFRVDATESETDSVLPGLWSLQESSAELADDVISALAEARLPSGLDPERANRRPGPHWTVTDIDGAVVLGPAGGLPQLAATDEPDRVFMPIRQGDERLQVGYEIDTDALFRLGMAALRLPFHGAPTVWFDGIYLTGDGSEMGRILTRLRAGWNTLYDGIATAGGFLVGKVIHTLGFGPSDPGDPFHAARRSQAERKHQNLATLVAPSPAKAEKAVIFVHGTLSTSFATTVDLRSELEGSSADLFRFEHDTLMPVAYNARDLAHFVRQLGCRDVLLISHSRGGLVATSAANFVRDEDGWTPEVWTYGTPHRGTPLARTGYGVSAVVHLVLLARAALSTPAEELFKLALSIGGHSHQGLEDMVPTSPFLTSMSRSAELWSRVSTFAGDAGQVQGLRVGSPWLHGAARAILGNAPHDQVVAVDAAGPPGGNPKGTFSTDRFSYFRDAQVREYVEGRLC